MNSIIKNKQFIAINGIDHFVTTYSTNENNEVVIYVHGGPLQPDTSLSHILAKSMSDKYTLVFYSQRGCGRTYYKNKKIDKNNDTATFDNLICDLDELVKWAKDKYHKDKIILMGHSYGTLIGIHYTSKHPENIIQYVGIGQFVNMKASLADVNDLINETVDKNNPRYENYKKAYDALCKDFSIENIGQVQLLGRRVLPAPKDAIINNDYMKGLFKSGNYSINDLRWQLICINFKKYFYLARHLIDKMINTNLKEDITSLEVPVVFITGVYDTACTLKQVEAYNSLLSAPSKSIISLEHHGHTPHYIEPDMFSSVFDNAFRK